MSSVIKLVWVEVDVRWQGCVSLRQLIELEPFSICMKGLVE